MHRWLHNAHARGATFTPCFSSPPKLFFLSQNWFSFLSLLQSPRLVRRLTLSSCLKYGFSELRWNVFLFFIKIRFDFHCSFSISMINSDFLLSRRRSHRFFPRREDFCSRNHSRACVQLSLQKKMWIAYLSSEILGAHQRPFQNRPRGNNHVCIAFLAALYNDMWVYLVFQYSTFPGILSSFVSSVLAPFQLERFAAGSALSCG